MLERSVRRLGAYLQRVRFNLRRAFEDHERREAAIRSSAMGMKISRADVADAMQLPHTGVRFNELAHQYELELRSDRVLRDLVERACWLERKGIEVP